MIDYIDKYSYMVKNIKPGDFVYIPINGFTTKTVVKEIHKIKTLKKNAIDSFLLKSIHSFLFKKNNFINTNLILALTKARDVLLSKCLKYNAFCQENILIETINGRVFNIKECLTDQIDTIT